MGQMFPDWLLFPFLVVSLKDCWEGLPLSTFTFQHRRLKSKFSGAPDDSFPQDSLKSFLGYFRFIRAFISFVRKYFIIFKGFLQLTQHFLMTLFVPIFKAENCKSPFLRMSDQIWEVNCENNQSSGKQSSGIS